MNIKSEIVKKFKLIKEKYIKIRDMIKNSKIYNDKILNSKIVKRKEFKPVLVLISFLIIALIITNLSQAFQKKDDMTTVITTNKAEEYYYKGEYDNSVNEYEKLQQNEEWPIYTVKMAEVLSVSGDIDKSNNLLVESVVKRNELIDKNGLENYVDRDAELGNYITITALMNGDYQKALEYGEYFMKDDSDSKILQRTMFTVYMANGKIDQAKTMIDEYKVDEESSYDLALYAKMNMLVDQWDKGFGLLKQAWYKNKDEIKVYDVIAQASAYNRNDIIMKIMELNSKEPNELCYKVWLIKCYSMLEETTDEANKLLDEVKDQDLGQTVFKTVIAKIYQHSGKNEEAEDLLKEVISSEEESYIGYHMSSWYYLENGDYDKAFEYCEKSILLNKDYPDNYGSLVPEIMTKSKDDRVIEPYYRTAIEKEPFNYNIVLNVADYYSNTQGNIDKAFSCFQLASLLKPNDPEIYYKMAMVKLTEGDTEKAVELINKSITIDETVPKYHRTLGTIYMNNGKTDEAIKEIRKAYDVDKNDILTLNNAGCYYISISGDIKRGMINIKAAYDGLKESTDQETRNIIQDNFNKAKALQDAYNNYDGAEIKIPEFQLFY